MSRKGYAKEASLESTVGEFSSLSNSMKNRPIDTRAKKSIRFGIDRVKHLFYFLHIRKQRIRCYLGDILCEGIILGLQEKLAILYLKDLDGVEIQELNNFEIEFFHFNLRYQFDVLVSEIQGNYIHIHIPDELESAKRRKTERISLDGLFVRFTLAYPPFPILPFSRAYPMDMRLYGPFAPIIEELKKDDPRMSLIYTELSKQVEKMGLFQNIQMYSSNSMSEKEKPSSSLIETILCTEKKVFFIPDTTKLESYFSPPESEGLINLHASYEKLEKESTGKGKSYCQEVQDKDIQDFIRSYACFPIMAFDKVIGHIKIFSENSRKKDISEEEFSNLELLIQILNYGIKKSIITQNYYQQINTRIRNISRDGLSFEIKDRKILDDLSLHIYMTLVLEIEDQVLNMKGRFIRHYFDKETESYGLGVQFYKVDPDADKILENLVYEHKRHLLKAGLF